MKKTLLILALCLVPFYVGATSVLSGPLGGTNTSSTVIGNIGNCLKVSSVNPLIWTIGSCGGAFTTTTINGLSSTAYTFATSGPALSLTFTAPGTVTFNLPTSTASQTGVLTGTDWTTFNNKQDKYWSKTGTNVYLTTSTDFVGIGSSTPGYPLTVNGLAYTTGIKLPTSSPAWQPGLLFYEQGAANRYNLTFYNNDSQVALQIGKENWKDVRNCNTGATILNGTAVYRTGVAIGQKPCIAVAYASSTNVNTASVIGVTTEDILNNTDGLVTTFGLVNGLNTSGFLDGDNVYLYASSTGGLLNNLTNVKPSYPQKISHVGEIDYSHINAGVLEVSIFDEHAFSDANDVNVAGAATGTVLMYDGTAWTKENTLFISGSNIGIGTSTPQTPLHVIGTSTLAGNTVNSGYIELTDSATPTSVLGALRMHSVVGNNISRLEVDTPFTAYGCDVVNRDSCQIVKNSSGLTLTLGQAVYANGASGVNPTVMKSQANSTTTAIALGLVATSSVANNGFFYVMTKGILRNVDTSAWAAGDVLYVSPVASGTLTNVRPSYPYLIERIGKVLISNVSNGEIDVQIAPAVLGQETGTISSTYNIGGANAITTSSINQYALVGASSTNNLISISSSSGVLSISATNTPALSSITFPDSTKTSTGYKERKFVVYSASTTLASGASSTIPMFYFGAVTLTQVVCSTDGANITLQADTRASSTPQTYGTAVFTGLVCTSSGVSTTTFSNANVSAGTYLVFWPSNTANSTTSLRVGYREKEQ